MSVYFIPNTEGCLSFAESGLCSNHGSCVLMGGGNETIIHRANVRSSRCVCDDGWTGLSDFVNMNQLDCPFRVTTLQILWILPILAGTCLLILGFQKLISTYRMTRTSSIKMLELRTIQRTLLSMASALCLTTVALIRCIEVTNTSLVVGKSVELTLLQMMGSSLFWIEVVFYTFSWLIIENRIALVGGNYDQTLREISHFRRLAICGGFFGLIASLSSILMVIENNYTDENLLTLILYFLNSIAACFIAFAFASSVRTVRRLLQPSLTSQLDLEQQTGTKDVLKKINVLLTTVTIVATTNAVFWQLFGWWPWLRSRIGYFIAPCWASILTLLFVGMAVTNPIAEWRSLGGDKQLEVTLRPSVSQSQRPSLQNEYRQLGS